MEGKDVLGCAQTGTGKTAAFALPILHRLLTAPVDKTRRGPVFPKALILSPTRELCNQIGESFATYGRHTILDHVCIFGGVSQYHQVKALHRGVDILVATPGRLMDLMEQRLVNLSEVCVFVLDEADRMLDMGFIQPIRKIAAALPKSPTKPRQTLLFSATMPKEIMHLADSLLHDPVKVAVTPVASAAPLITQQLYLVNKAAKQSLLQHLLADRTITRAVVFTKTKHGADRVSRKLRGAGISADEIHGNKAQNARTRALDGFRYGRTRVLVATDVAARGLDVDGITHVINFDLPMEPESYVHRIGRTGRAGATGIAISFCDSTERGLLRDIERLTAKKIPLMDLPSNLPSLPRDDGPHMSGATVPGGGSSTSAHGVPPRRDHPRQQAHGAAGHSATSTHANRSHAQIARSAPHAKAAHAPTHHEHPPASHRPTESQSHRSSGSSSHPLTPSPAHRSSPGRFQPTPEPRAKYSAGETYPALPKLQPTRDSHEPRHHAKPHHSGGQGKQHTNQHGKPHGNPHAKPQSHTGPKPHRKGERPQTPHQSSHPTRGHADNHPAARTPGHTGGPGAHRDNRSTTPSRGIFSRNSKGGRGGR